MNTVPESYWNGTHDCTLTGHLECSQSEKLPRNQTRATRKGDGMNAQQIKAKQSKDIARASISRLTNERLAETWMLTNEQPSTRKVTILRGWLLDELERRMNQVTTVWEDLFPNEAGRDRFDEWLTADSVQGGDFVSPLPYLS